MNCSFKGCPRGGVWNYANGKSACFVHARFMDEEAGLLSSEARDHFNEETKSVLDRHDIARVNNSGQKNHNRGFSVSRRILWPIKGMTDRRRLRIIECRKLIAEFERRPRIVANPKPGPKRRNGKYLRTEFGYMVRLARKVLRRLEQGA